MADGGGAGQAREHLGLKNFLHQAHALFQMQRGAVGGDDAGGFLAAMLQGVETQIGELGGFGVAEDAADTAVIVEVIVVDVNHDCSDAALRRERARSMAPAQIARRVAEESRITVAAIVWMLEAPRVTAPISRAATLILCRKVQHAGKRACAAAETTARAPRSPKRASSAGSRPSSATSAARGLRRCAKQDSASATARPPSLRSCAEASRPSRGERHQRFDQALFGGEIDRRRRAADDAGDRARVFGGGEFAQRRLCVDGCAASLARPSRAAVEQQDHVAFGAEAHADERARHLRASRARRERAWDRSICRACRCRS